MDKIRSTTTVEPEEPQEINYEPPPLDTVSISPDQVLWIRPPPVIRAEPSCPGAPLHECKRWVKYLERPNTEGTLQEVGTQHNFDHYTYSMYDREKRWHIHFLCRPKLPEGCVSNPEVFRTSEENDVNGHAGYTIPRNLRPWRSVRRHLLQDPRISPF